MKRDITNSESHEINAVQNKAFNRHNLKKLSNKELKRMLKSEHASIILKRIIHEELDRRIPKMDFEVSLTAKGGENE